MAKPGFGVLALLLLGLVVAPATPAGAEAFIDLYVGKSFTQPGDLKIRQPSQQSDFTFSGVSFDDRSFENPLYYGGRGGYFFEAVPWFGLLAPAGTPQPIIDKVHRETVRVLTLPAMRRRLEDLGLDIIGNSPAEFAAVIRSEIPEWAKVIKGAGIKASE